MKNDLNEFLEGWEFDPETPSARLVEAEDGRRMVQLRIDMGVVQMEATGRPDGEKPHGYDSFLDYYRTLERRGKMPETLSREACADLLREIGQYCARAQAYSALGEPVRVYDDAEHVLDTIDLVSDLAEADEDAWHADQVYPSIRLAHAEAAAQLARQGARLSRAKDILEQAIADIERFYRESQGETDDGPATAASEFDAPPDSPEVTVLRNLIAELEEEKPKSAEENLQKALAKALAKEDYERAAAIRDQLRDLRSPPPRTPSSGKGKSRKPSPPSDSGGAS